MLKNRPKLIYLSSWIIFIIFIFWGVTLLAQATPNPASAEDTSTQEGTQNSNTNTDPSSPPGTNPDPSSGDATNSEEAPSDALDPIQLNLSSEHMGREDMILFWQDRNKELDTVLDSLTSLSRDYQNLSRTFESNLERYSADLDRLLRIYQFSKGNPLEREDILRQFNGLLNNLSKDLVPLNDLATNLAQKKNELTTLNSIVKNMISDPPFPEEGEFNVKISVALQQIETTTTELNNFLFPGKDLLDRINTVSIKINEDIPQTWKTYYLTETRIISSRFPLLSDGDNDITIWVQSFSSRAIFFYPQTIEEWISGYTASFLSLVLFGIIGLFLWRFSTKLYNQPSQSETITPSSPDSSETSPEPSSEESQDANHTLTQFSKFGLELQHILKNQWIFLAVGTSLIVGSSNSLGGTYLFFMVPGLLILIWGLASLSWKLRSAGKINLENETSPLARFYIPAAIGVVFLYADVPASLITILWFLIMLFFLLKLRSISANADKATNTSGNNNSKLKLPFLERFAYASAFYFAIVSLFVAIIGFPRLAILVFMLLFALVNILVLGSSLLRIGHILSNFFFQKTETISTPEGPLNQILVNRPFLKAFFDAFILPLTCFLSLISALPWLMAVPGSNYIIQNFLDQGYSIGEASFDLSRVFVILALFFLFRSLNNLGVTSLRHLPDRIGNVNKNIIPHAQMLLNYGIWAVFLLIGLSLIGVNLTSLWVLVGGLSVGIGFGLQTLFNNLVSGIILIFGRSIRVGDWVEVGGVSGTVRMVGIRCTTVETSSKAAVYVPNSKLVSDPFVNWTSIDGRQVRRSLIFKTYHGADIEKVLTLLCKTASEIKNVMQAPAPSALLDNIDEKSLQFILYVNIVSLDDSYEALSKLRAAITKVFDENDIKLYRESLEIKVAQQIK
ncbi:MAG: mechanosensitive ion channel [Deltaproteobacteria bacterium]|jgi:small-conductance mechanosensitive channel|nr:mechanosensitive ion channel [Deltaproteobacteria bacterium]